MIRGVVAASHRNDASALSPPGVGAYWNEQGGYYAGTISYSDGRTFHLVVAEKAAELANQNYGYYDTLVGAASHDDGAFNQEAVTALGLTGGGSFPPTAFKDAADWTKDEHSDFYLPSLDELNLIYTNLAPAKPGQVALFASGGNQSFVQNYYWSSTEVSTTRSQFVRFTDGAIGDHWKYQNFYARPIRRVAAS